MPASEYITLNTGAKMPALGLGTWKSQPGAVENAVEYALKNGYKHIDTATAYSNEKEVAAGIKASGVPRSEIFLTTKVNNPDMGRVEEALSDSLKWLETDYLDLWLMHWPAPMTEGGLGPDHSIDWLDTWKEMERLYKKYPEKIKAIGISNFSIKYLERLLPEVTVTPAMNQIELHPSCPQQDVVDYCLSKNIAITAYSPLGSNDSPLLENAVVNKLAKKYDASPANILISLQLNRPQVAVLTKSVTNSRILANKKVIDLTPEEVTELHDIDKTHHFRVCHPNWTGFTDGLGFDDCQ